MEDSLRQQDLLRAGLQRGSLLTRESRGGIFGLMEAPLVFEESWTLFACFVAFFCLFECADIGCDTSSPFSEPCLLAEIANFRCDTPLTMEVSQRYLCYHMKARKMGALLLLRNFLAVSEMGWYLNLGH